MHPAHPQNPDPSARHRIAWCVAATGLWAGLACAEPALQPVPALRPAPSGDAAREQAPLYLRAEQLSGRPGIDVQAAGAVELRHAGVVIRADQLRYDRAEDLAVAQGKVRISFAGSVFSGPEVQMKVQRLEGFVLQPEYHLAMTGAGGRAERVDFIGEKQARIVNADYTSCTRDGGTKPDWVISADHLSLNAETSEGVAEGAVLRFLDVPILALPRLSFPLSDQRKSGWLPPSLDITSGSGVEFGQPYYWNIAPNRDATIAPRLSTRRGFGVDGEFRYLERDFAGTANLDWLPYDQQAQRSRYWLTFEHEGRISDAARYSAIVERVSDDEWWNDFPRKHRALTPRLLPVVAQIEHDFGNAEPRRTGLRAHADLAGAAGSEHHGRAVRARPQIGVRSLGNRRGPAIRGRNRIQPLHAARRARLHDDDPAVGRRTRAPAGLGVAGPGANPAGGSCPACCSMPLRTAPTSRCPTAGARPPRVIPTFSVDGGVEFERRTEWLGRALRQTLEPRLLYVYTPYVDQATSAQLRLGGQGLQLRLDLLRERVLGHRPRVATRNALTAGVTTRLLDAGTGAEVLQLGVVQRYLFQDQRDHRHRRGRDSSGFSDVLLRGSTSVMPPWNLEAYAAVQPERRPLGALDRRRALLAGAVPHAEPDLPVCARPERADRGRLAVADLRRPGRGARRAARQRVQRAPGTASVASTTACGQARHRLGGRPRVRRRLLDRAHGGRAAGPPASAKSTTQVLFQLELVGLSRLGSNPLKVLKDNIPGYRLLRDRPQRHAGRSAFYD